MEDQVVISSHNSRTIRSLIEPAIFLVVFAWSLSGPVLTNQILLQTCESVYMFNSTSCKTLFENNKSNETKVIKSR